MSSAAEPTWQQSLYRRHRPRTFADVVGQESVVRTLTNAVERDKVHHAYLFVGSRGTGKTSMAKILAACLNCERGPTAEPCGRCDSCRSIAQANSLDVIEMDAASNNSVDDIRELRESVSYAPVSGRTKVYILDEAHMLSTAAWNAFLKTLEEPPPSTVFVLATTEAQKVPATVIDRCHRFDFQRPTVEQVASVVRRAADAESIEIAPAAVAAVARAATGSFRDALGTLEQLMTYSGPEIGLQDALAVLGVTDSALLDETIDAVGAGDARAALLAVGRCAEAGRDAGAFAADLEARARELLVVQTLGDVPPELALTPEADARLGDQAGRIPATTLISLLELLGAAREAVRAGSDSRTQLEIALVKAAKPEVDLSTRALLHRIERLEGESGPASGPPRILASSDADLAVGRLDGPDAGSESGPAAGSGPPAESGLAAGSGPPAESGLAAGSGPAAEREPAAERSIQDEADLETLASLWPAVVEMVRSENALLGALIAEAQPVAVQGRELTVAFPSSAPFLKKKAEDPTNRTAVSDALQAVTARRMALSYELRAEMPKAHSSVGPGGGRTEEEWVAHLISEFDAEELEGELAYSVPEGVGAEQRSEQDQATDERAPEHRRARKGE